MTSKETADYVSLSQMTMSEATDHEYTLILTGYQIKLLLWGLFFMQRVETGIAQLDYPKSAWRNLRDDVIAQVDAEGENVTPDPKSQNHIDVMEQIRAVDEFTA